MIRAFFDSNILVHAFTDGDRSAIAQQLLQAGGVVGVQSLNELATVMQRKDRRKWSEIDHAITLVREQCLAIVALDDALQRDGLRLAQRYRLSVYDGMIVAAALAADCDILYSEDIHNGLIVDGTLRIVNPFAVAS